MSENLTKQIKDSFRRDKNLSALIVFFIFYVLVYLIASLYYLSFTLGWYEIGRPAIVLWGGLLIGYILLIIILRVIDYYLLVPIKFRIKKYEIELSLSQERHSYEFAYYYFSNDTIFEEYLFYIAQAKNRLGIWKNITAKRNSNIFLTGSCFCNSFEEAADRIIFIAPSISENNKIIEWEGNDISDLKSLREANLKTEKTDATT